MGSDNSFNTSLSLGLGNISQPIVFPKHHLLVDDQYKKTYNSSLMSFDHSSFPSLTLGLSSSEAPSHHIDVMIDTSKRVEKGESTAVLYRQSSSISGVSTFSNSSVKRERDVSEEEVEVERVSSKVMISDIDQDDQDGGARKKLRLTKEQSLVLEESFKAHSTLNPKLKQALAKRLNLRPRQVEVWFQNRRARTKLKQNEVDCELLKKCCDSLTEENNRLQKEIQELKAIKVAGPQCYMQFPAATLTMCPSCERITGVSTETKASKSPFSIGSKPQFFRALNHPSAAPCYLAS